MVRKVKRSELRSNLEASLEKDKEAVLRIRAQLASLFDLCQEQSVEPETLLHEFMVATQLSEYILMSKVAGDGHGKKGGKKAMKELEKFIEVIEKKGVETYMELGSRGDKGPRPKKVPSPQLPNELQPYVPSKERPCYIQ